MTLFDCLLLIAFAWFLYDFLWSGPDHRGCEGVIKTYRATRRRK